MKQTLFILLAISASSLFGQGLTVRAFNSGFREAHDTYNGLSVASDGNVYYVLCAQTIDVGGKVFRFAPASDAGSRARS